jgi:hypothetical protein
MNILIPRIRCKIMQATQALDEARRLLELLSDEDPEKAELKERLK